MLCCRNLSVQILLGEFIKCLFAHAYCIVLKIHQRKYANLVTMQSVHAILELCSIITPLKSKHLKWPLKCGITLLHDLKYSAQMWCAIDQSWTGYWPILEIYW